MAGSIVGVRETLAAFRKLPKDASVDLRDANLKISDDLAEKMRQAALGRGSQAALVAPSIKARRDRVPFVQAGGRKRVGQQKRKSKGQRPTTVSDLLYGANFGANVLKQFPAVATPDHFMYKTLEANDALLEREWLKAVDDTLGKWGSGG